MSAVYNPGVFTVITSKVNFAQNAANAGAGAIGDNSKVDVTGLVLGPGQTLQAGVEFATLGMKNVPKAVPIAGSGLGIISAGVAAQKLNQAQREGKPYAQDDIAALVGGVAGGAGGAAAAAILILTPAGWVAVALGAVVVAGGAVSTGAGVYQLYAKAKGLTWDPATGQSVEVTLTQEQRIMVDKHLQETMPMWNDSAKLNGLGIDLGLPAGAQLQVQGSLFCGPDWQASNVPSPSGLDTAARNSAALINTTGAHTTQFNSGGGVDDLWVVEKNAGRYSGTRDQFRADFVASNGQVDPKTLLVQQGQNYYVPQRSANGNTVYHYSNGATVMNNAITGEYRMEVPNTDGSGGKTVYSRTADDVGYTVKQVTTNASGKVVFEQQSYQNTLDADLNPVSTTSVSGNQTTTRNWLTDNVFQTDTFVGPPAPTNPTPSTSSLDFGPVSYNLFDAAQNNNASYKMWQLNQNNGLSNNAYNSFTQQSSNFVVDYSLGGSGSSGLGLQPPPSWSDPIGAFYDSQSSAFDNAASIANKTTRAMNAQGQGLTAAQLAALDTNNDSQLSTAEASGVRLWADVNEDGHLDSGELLGVSAVIKSADYNFYTRGSALTVSASADASLAPTINVPTDRPPTLTANAPGNAVLTATVAPVAPGNPVYASLPVAIGFTAAALPAAPGYGGVPASNYRSLRDTDNVYLFGNGSFVAFTASQVKINNGNRTTMIGTDGADSFDGSTYANTGFLTTACW